LENRKNVVELCGALAGGPMFSHEGRNERFFTFPLDIERLSVTVDTINIIARENLIRNVEVKDAEYVHVFGELRSYNNRSGYGNKLVITVFAHQIELTDGEGAENKNMVSLTVRYASTDFRSTPMGRDICDIMLGREQEIRQGRQSSMQGVGQTCGKGGRMGVGTEISIEGRYRAERYIKVIDGKRQRNTACEVFHI
jgi:hypothetical protein